MKEICPLCRRKFTTLKKYWEAYQGDKLEYDTFLRNVKKGMFPQEAIKPLRKHKKHYIVTKQTHKVGYTKIDEEF